MTSLCRLYNGKTSKRLLIIITTYRTEPTARLQSQTKIREIHRARGRPEFSIEYDRLFHKKIQVDFKLWKSIDSIKHHASLSK